MSDWLFVLTATEKTVLTYTEKGTLDEASVRRSDVDELRAVGLRDKDALLIPDGDRVSQLSIRMAVAFDVLPS